MFKIQSVGKNISTLRKDKNMTQMELADEMGVSFHGGVIIGLN